MASFNVEINSKSNKYGLHSLFIRITVNRRLKRFKTDIQIPLDHFNPKAKYGRWVRTLNPRHVKLNSDIENFIQDLKERVDQIANNGQPILEEISKSTAPHVYTVSVHFAKVLDDMKVEKSYVYFKGSKSMLTRFENFVGGNTPLREIDTTHIQRFKTMLISTKISNVTINNIMKHVHFAFIPALRANLIDKDPFRAHDSLAEQPSKKQRLTDEQIAKMEGLDLSPDRSAWLYHTRNMYLFSYYNAGIRVADLMQLRHGNITPDGRLEYEMSKTGHSKSIRLNQPAQTILGEYYDHTAGPEQYLFPVLSQSSSKSFLGIGRILADSTQAFADLTTNIPWRFAASCACSSSSLV